MKNLFYISFFIVVFFSCSIYCQDTKQKLTGLPGVSGPLSSTHYTGYVNTNETTGAFLFYWLAESQGNPSTDPLLIWLTGGPGCSSELAFFRENGPYHMQPNEVPVENKWSWNMNANVLYVDQPVGTGFSYLSKSLPANYVHNEKQVAAEFIAFLQGWLNLFPEYNSRKLFISGESYAGHYVPAISNRILTVGTSVVNLDLQGISIGDGMTDPYYQYASYAQYAYSHGLIDFELYTELNQQYAKCEKAIDTGVYSDESSECNIILAKIAQAGGPFNNYDVTKTCLPTEPLCYNFTATTSYLNRDDVQKALGVNKKWNICSNLVHLELTKDWFTSQSGDVNDILDKYNKRVLVYNGVNDYIVNFLGSSEWVRQFQWSGHDGYNKASSQVWTNDGLIAGHSRTYQGLTMLSVVNAGHMVPMDVPSNAFDMITRFMNNQPFN